MKLPRVPSRALVVGLLVSSLSACAQQQDSEAATSVCQATRRAIDAWHEALDADHRTQATGAAAAASFQGPEDQVQTEGDVAQADNLDSLSSSIGGLHAAMRTVRQAVAEGDTAQFVDGMHQVSQGEADLVAECKHFTSG